MRVLFSFKTVSKRVVSFTLAFFIIISSISFESKASNNVKIIEAIQVKGATFNTGIIPNEHYTIEISFSLKNPQNQYVNVYEAGKMAIRNEASLGIFARFGMYNEKFYKPEADLEYYVCQKENVFTVNNDTVRKPVMRSLNNTSLTFGNFVGTVNYFCVKNENSQSLMELYPAIDDSGKACMYDTINKKYLYGKGTVKAIEGENKYYKYTETSNENSEQKKDEIIEETKPEKENDQKEDNNTIKDNEGEKEQEANANDDKAEAKFVKVKALKIDNGTFNTKIKIDQNNSYEMIFSMNNLGIYKNIITSSPYELRNEAKSGLFFRHGWYKEKVCAPEVDVMVDYLQKKNVAYVNGVKKRTAVMQTAAATKNLIFGGFKGIIEAFKVWDQSDKLIADYIPVIDEEGVACLYDNISGSFLYCSNKCTAVQNVSHANSAPENTSSASEEQTNQNDQSSQVVKEVSVNTNLTKEEAFRKEVITMIENGDTSVHDISGYGFKSYKEVSAIYNDVISNEERIAFNSAFNMYYRQNTNNGRVCEFWICMMDKDYLSRYNKMKKIVQEVKNTTAGMTDIQKIVYIHDYVADKTVYSLSNDFSYTAAGALVNGKAICTGYARAMVLLLTECGIESDIVSCSQMNHTWTKVKLNGKWYFVDVTWDDTVRTAEADISHKYLLRNDKEFKTYGYYGWEGTISTSSEYSNWKIHDIIGKINYNNNKWSYIDKNTNMPVQITF
ncbi:transglutaminase domain-containing protein [Butyrivibrio sp. FC2001]|uniref:transglutaminase domain-containing protein n=1 Tax=Butyrivibrio sp. FC2001 TaxID=1280671 RepID=UPI00040BF011|nr:transglutaminase domain-containing protein [Butyrivibrio sp. FC2001]